MNLEQQKLVEKIGIFNEQQGMQPVASRIVGLLLVSNETELTFDQIRQELNVSKSAVSNSLNLLLRLGQIEYTTHPGERKRYFRNRVEQWNVAVEEGLTGVLSFKKLLLEVRELRDGSNVEFITKLDELIDFLDYLNAELPLLLDRWKQKKNK